MVKFSFIVPVFNIKQIYFKQCMDSLIHQTLKDFEIWLIDDGSTNGAANWCDLLAKQYSDCIRVIHKENEGVSVARNIGITEANGEYLLFIDPDDWIELNLCEKLNSILNKNDVDILIYSYFKEYRNKSEPEEGFNEGIVHRISTEEKIELIQNLIDSNRKAEYKYYNSNIFTAPWGKCYKRQFITQNNIFFKKGLVKSQDTIFNLYAFWEAKNIIEYKYPLYHYRIVKSSISNRYNKDIINIQLQILGEIKRFMNINGLDNIYREAFMHRCISAYRCVLGLNIFNPDNEDDIRKRRKNWISFIDTDYIKNLNSRCIKKYPLEIRLFMAVTKMHLFYIIWIPYNFRKKKNGNVKFDEMYE